MRKVVATATISLLVVLVIIFAYAIQHKPSGYLSDDDRHTYRYGVDDKYTWELIAIMNYLKSNKMPEPDRMSISPKEYDADGDPTLLRCMIYYDSGEEYELICRPTGGVIESNIGDTVEKKVDE